MTTLKDIFEVLWHITRVSIIAREPDGDFCHAWEYGDDVHETIHMQHDRESGKMTIVKEKINAHGDSKRGTTEMGWGVKDGIFPKEILEAPITHMNVCNWHNGEVWLTVDIEMQALTAMGLIPVEVGE